MEITAVILTLNEEKHIVHCINSLQWVDHIIVFDSFSTDQTCSLAQAAGAKIYQHPFENYAQQRNAALDTIKTEWVLFIDADERTTPAAQDEIRDVITKRPEKGWHIPRHNYIFGKQTVGAGWWPDYQLRLFKHGHVHYERPVHEIAIVEGKTGHLQTPLIHYNYDTVAQFHATQQKYTTYEARILHEKKIVPKQYTAYTQSIRHFWWRFFTLKGYRAGLHGIHLAMLMAYYEWKKYRLLQNSYDDR